MSPVLAAMGVRPEIGLGAIRFSIGRTTTHDDVEYVVAQLKKHVPCGTSPASL
jgi:cysteine desulfurase